jgi:Flp pilus assembly protein TadG
VEFAIVFGSALILAFTVIQAGLVYYAHSLALGAATQGANAARGYGASAGTGDTHAREFLSQAGSGLLNQHVSVHRGGEQVTVVVTGTAVSLLPGLTFTVSKSVSSPVERATTP